MSFHNISLALSHQKKTHLATTLRMFFRQLFAESTGYRCPTTIASPNRVLHTASDFEPKAGEVSSRFMTWIHQLRSPRYRARKSMGTLWRAFWSNFNGLIRLSDYPKKWLKSFMLPCGISIVLASFLGSWGVLAIQRSWFLSIIQKAIYAISYQSDLTL